MSEKWKLSQLMRQGVIAQPQLRELEAAYFALTGLVVTDEYQLVWGLDLVNVDSIHPVTHETLSVASICVSLTDEYSWTIWQIIDWLESEAQS